MKSITAIRDREKYRYPLELLRLDVMLRPLRKGLGMPIEGAAGVTEGFPRWVGPWVERRWRGRREEDETMIGCLALAQLLLKIHKSAESDSRAQRGEKGYSEPHKGEQCVFHQSFLSPSRRGH